MQRSLKADACVQKEGGAIDCIFGIIIKLYCKKCGYKYASSFPYVMTSHFLRTYGKRDCCQSDKAS